MEGKIAKIIAIIASTLLCGLPGFIGVCFSSLAILGALLPESGIPRDELPFLLGTSVATTGLSLICLVIPVGIGFWSWRAHKKEARSMEELLLPEDDF